MALDHERVASPELESIKTDVVKLIAKQRLLRLTEGAKFVKYSQKGQKLKDKFWFCRLSSNHRSIHYKDLDDNRNPQIDELPNKINVSDIKSILVGKDCPHTKDGYMKKSTIDLAFSIVFESDHEDHLNFVASDQKTYSYWTDGLNVLLKNNMTSDEFHKDLQILSKIELKMRSMSKQSSQN